MIYCVRHDGVRRYLVEQGFRSIGVTAGAEAFIRDRQLVSIREPNVNGHIPEILVNDAFATADLDLPAWEVFWCD